jgi:hypothetical protein
MESKRKTALEISDEIGINYKPIKFTTEDIMDSLKGQLDIHINALLERGARKANIEITVLHYLKKILKKD